MNINIKIILFTILELAFLLLINFIGLWAVNLSVIICIIELINYEKTLLES